MEPQLCHGKAGEILVWDATCSDTLAPSQRDITVREPGAVAAAAEHRKRAKYSHLEATHHFDPLAVESLGVLGHEACAFLCDFARRLTSATDNRISFYCYPAWKCCSCFGDDWGYG